MNKKINEDCPCKRKCDLHGDCDACKTHHEHEKKVLPTCERLAQKKQKKVLPKE